MKGGKQRGREGRRPALGKGPLNLRCETWAWPKRSRGNGRISSWELGDHLCLWRLGRVEVGSLEVSWSSPKEVLGGEHGRKLTTLLVHSLSHPLFLLFKVHRSPGILGGGTKTRLSAGLWRHPGSASYQLNHISSPWVSTSSSEKWVNVRLGETAQWPG